MIYLLSLLIYFLIGLHTQEEMFHPQTRCASRHQFELFACLQHFNRWTVHLKNYWVWDLYLETVNSPAQFLHALFNYTACTLAQVVKWPEKNSATLYTLLHNTHTCNMQWLNTLQWGLHIHCFYEVADSQVVSLCPLILNVEQKTCHCMDLNYQVYCPPWGDWCY